MNTSTHTTYHANVPTTLSHGPRHIKVGLDVHARFYVAVTQIDHAIPGPPRRFLPHAFLPWVTKQLAAGHQVHVVHESCGFGFTLHRALLAAGAKSYVIAPQALDEGSGRVKTDGRDAMDDLPF